MPWGQLPPERSELCVSSPRDAAQAAGPPVVPILQVRTEA